MKLSIILFSSLTLAIPLIPKRSPDLEKNSHILHRRYDFDHNGVPDWCYEDQKGLEHCLQVDDTWTTFAASSSIYPATSSTKAISHTQSTPQSSIPKPNTTTAPKPTISTKGSSVASTATLPSPSTFSTDKGTKWRISTVGTIYSSTNTHFGWDKGRTSVLSGIPFWNFGDVMDMVDGFSYETGFSMGAAFYATPSTPLRVDMKDITNVGPWDFAKPFSGDPTPNPKGPTPSWGMDTSNVAEISPGVGIGFVWEIWRSSDGTYEDRGSGMIRVTLGEKVPIANRTGPLITGPDGLQVGLMTVLAAEGYIYTYTNGGGSGIVVGRALLVNAFDASKYEFLKMDGRWVVGIPKASDMSYGCQGAVHSDNQGSIMWNAHFGKYILFTGAFANFMNFYTSATPYGPWSKEYGLDAIPGYGINVHPWMSSDPKVLYVSGGPNGPINLYKVEFDY